MKKFKLCTCVTAARLTVRPFDIEIFDTDVLQIYNILLRGLTPSRFFRQRLLVLRCLPLMTTLENSLIRWNFFSCLARCLAAFSWAITLEILFAALFAPMPLQTYTMLDRELPQLSKVRLCFSCTASCLPSTAVWRCAMLNRVPSDGDWKSQGVHFSTL